LESESASRQSQVASSNHLKILLPITINRRAKYTCLQIVSNKTNGLLHQSMISNKIFLFLQNNFSTYVVKDLKDNSFK